MRGPLALRGVRVMLLQGWRGSIFERARHAQGKRVRPTVKNNPVGASENTAHLQSRSAMEVGRIGHGDAPMAAYSGLLCRLRKRKGPVLLKNVGSLLHFWRQ